MKNNAWFNTDLSVLLLIISSFSMTQIAAENAKFNSAFIFNINSVINCHDRNGRVIF